jgi:hypothetical protein
MMFDLMRHCALLRQHVEAGLVGYGLNHEMSDFKMDRKKKLDLVICRPRSTSANTETETFAEQAERIGAVLTPTAKKELHSLPTLRTMPVGAVHLALEAKAAMTEFGKARPRLYDELNSSHAAIHGNSQHTIAAGLTMVNLAGTFVSPTRNYATKKHPHTVHKQPGDAESVIAKIREIPRRGKEGEDGYDALAIVVVDCPNDGTPIKLVKTPPAPQSNDIYSYEMTVHRLVQLYEQRFNNI